MDGCVIVFHDVPKVNDIIKELENNNPASCYKLGLILNTEDFLKYCEDDSVAKTRDLASINRNTLKRLIKNYRNSHLFNVSNTSKVNAESGMYQFRSQAAFDAAVQFTADLISAINYRSAAADKAKSNYLVILISTAKNAFKKQLIAKANQYGKFDSTNLEGAYYAIENNGTDQERNFKDLVQSALSDPNFWNEVFYNSKVASLGRNTDFQDEAYKVAIMSDNNEDVISDAEQGDEVDLSTKQWDFGSNISNYTEHISEVVRQYFDTLQRLNSTQRFANGAYDVDRTNPLGVPMCHSYQECTVELSNIINNLGGFKSLDAFIKAIEAVANNKKEFAAFIKLANDMKANSDLANKIYTDLNKFIIDKLEITVDNFGTIKSIQSNTSNNPVRKLYFSLRNDLKGSSIQNNNIELEMRIAEIEDAFKAYKKDSSGDSNTKVKSSRRKNLAENIDKNNALKFDKIVSDIKELYKTYFPSLNELAIDNYIERNNKETDGYRNNNVDRLLSYLEDINKSAQLSLAEKQNRDYQYNLVRKENKTRLNNYNNAVASGVTGVKYIEQQLPKFDGEYLIKSDEVLGNVSLNLEPYINSKAELNSRNSENNLNSDLIYNNFITNIAKICGDREVLSDWVKEKLKSTEYAYSNILIDDPDKGIIGLFRRKANGDYELSPYAEKIISPYLFNGVTNRQDGTNASYTTISDGDYFLTGLYAFIKEIQTYKKYNTINANGGSVKTAPFMMRIPSDAPKNFAISLPVYSASDLWSYDAATMKAYIKAKKANIIKVAPYESADEQLTKFNAMELTEDEVIDYIVNTPINLKVSPSKLLMINAKVGTKQSLAYAIHNKEGYQYHYFTGTLKDLGNGNYILDNPTYTGQAVFSDYISSFDSKVTERITNEFKEEHPEAKQINKKSPLFNAYLNVVKGEIFDYYKALYDVENNPKDSLIEFFHYNPSKGVRDSKGNLTGNVFNFTTLDSSVGYDIDAVIKSIISAASSTGDITLSGYSLNSNSGASITFSESVEQKLADAVSNWLEHYQSYLIKETNDKFGSFLENISNDEIVSYGMNAYMHNINFDDLFEGNSKYYKNPQTFLKRAKQCQAGGTSYSISNYKTNDSTDSPFTQSVNEIPNSTLTNGTNVLTFPNGKPVTLRTGWNAVVIKNSIRPSTNKNMLYDKLIDSGVNKEKAIEIAKGFGYVEEQADEDSATTTTINDAQSYITIYEAARRLKILGEYPKYAKLIEQLTDATTDVEHINPNELEGFIQVMKNFYFDHFYNNKYGRHVPRQIKNAEYVLVPKFLVGNSLGQLADFMIENDIDQINTQETSKATNFDVLTFWDNNGEVNKDAFDTFKKKAIEVKQPFSYMYLYKQQDVPQHILDAKNKAGIQVMKKILDNSQASVESHKNNFIKAYVANIREDFNKLMDKYGIKFDAQYNIIHKNGNSVDYSRIYKMAMIEAARLGLDSNLIDYLNVKTEYGSPIMPNYMNMVSSKIESIAQSQFNKFITRQKLPGWHAAQITGVGLDGLIKKSKSLKNGETIETEDGKRVELAYHKNGAEIEVLLPKWAKSMFNQYDAEGNLVKEITIDDVDPELLNCIGYRIPTEGKQSMSVLKVVGFLPEWAGSTIVVPDEWVTQTGSDFDVDSVYGISYETYLGKDGRVHKVEYSNGIDDESIFLRYAKYVNTNVNKLIKQENNAYLSEEEKKENFKKIERLVKIENEEGIDWYKNQIAKILKEKESGAYKMLDATTKERLSKVLRSDAKFKDKVSDVLNTIVDLQMQGNNNQALEDFYKIYREISDLIKEQINFNTKIYDNIVELYRSSNEEFFANAINARAKAGGLLTLDEFSKLSVEDQNDRRARNNRIVSSMISIMNNKSSLEENLARSNFEDIVQANKDIDKIDESSKRNRSVYNLFDQIQFHRNAMGGATLKAFSVSRDTGNSVFNVSKAKLKNPIKVRYGKNIDLNVAKEAFDVKDGIVYHDAIGNSKNNKNVTGDYVTVTSSHTTAHILDAIKEGAIKNENEYTFAAFKTLFDIGCDAYTSILWIRQPGIDRIVNAYFESQSVFIRGNFNPIHTAIKRIAADLKIKIRGEIVGDNNSITEIMDTLKAEYNDEFTKLFPNSNISFENDHTADVNMIDVPSMEKRLKAQGDESMSETTKLLLDLGAVLNFDYINNYSKIISNHIRVLNPDKFGAKQTIYATRKVVNDIMSLIKSGDADFLLSDGKPLIESIYPGISKAAEASVFIPNIYLAEDGSTSKYEILDAFLRNSTVPSILINQGLFETESFNFVTAIESIQNYLGGTINESIYNDFKKYTLEYFYKNYSILSEPIKLGRNDIIENDTEINSKLVEEGLSPVEEESKRIYGYGYDINYEVKINNIANPTASEVAEFNKLTPAQKVHFVQRHLSGDQRTIFNYINVNLFNGYEFRTRGISSQVIRFDDQQQDMESIYKMFDAAFNNSNPIIRLTAIDIIKYAFVVEGYQFRKNNISKIIKNNALYTSIEDGGTGVIDNLKNVVSNVSDKRLVFENIYEDYIRSHSNIPQITSYRVRYNNKKASISTIPNTQGLYYFNLSVPNDLKTAKELRLVKEVTNPKNGEIKNKITSSYINIINGKVSTLYKVISYNNNNKLEIYLAPLNKLEANEHGKFSANPINNKYPSIEYYDAIINESMNQNVSFARLAELHNTLFNQEIIDSFKYKKPKVEKEVVVPTDNTFLISAAEQDSAIKHFIQNINNKFENNKTGIYWSWNGSQLLKKAFDTLNVDSVQTIVGNDGKSTDYLIRRTKATLTNKVTDSNKLEGLAMAQRNGVKSTNEIYIVKPLEKAEIVEREVNPEDAIHASSIDMDIAPNITPLGNLAQQFLLDVKTRARVTSDDNAAITYEDILKYGIDENSISSIEQRKNDTIKRCAEFYITKAHEIERLLNDFIKNENGEACSIVDEFTINAIQQDEKLRNEYISLILQASTFGNSFPLINEIATDNLDPDTKRNIRGIQETINNVKNNIILKEGFNIVAEKIFKPLSTNPNFDKGLSDITNYILKDASVLDWLFQDAQELSYPIVQIILRQAKTKLDTLMFEGDDYVNAYKKEINKIKAEAAKNGKQIDWNNIVDNKNGTFITNHNDNYIKDRNALNKEVAEIKDKYGKYSVEYLRAKHKQEQWYLDNAEQRYVAEYYKQKLDNEAKMLTDGNIDYYIQFRKLEDRRNDLLSIFKGNRTEADANEIKRLNSEIREMQNHIDIDTGEWKSEKEYNRAVRLKEYVDNVVKIKKAFFTRETRAGFEEDLKYYLNIITKYKHYDSVGRQLENENVLLQIDEYAKAVEWLNENTYYRMDEKLQLEIKQAFDDISNTKTENKNVQFKSILSKVDNPYDNYGIINGTKFNEAQVNAIREEQQQQMYGRTNDGDTAEVKLLRNRAPITEIYTSKFYDRLRNKNEVDPAVKSAKMALIKDINAILIDAIEPSTGKVRLSDLTIDQLRKLSELYDLLGESKRLQRKDKDVSDFIKNEVTFLTDKVTYMLDQDAAKQKGKEFLAAWSTVAKAKNYDDNGIFIGYLDEGNSDIYGYIRPKVGTDGEIMNKEYIDTKKTKALKFINENIEFVPTKYYWKAREEAIKADRLKEFEEQNHILNPLSGKTEPIRIWTTIQVKEEAENAKNYVASYNNTKSKPLEHTANPNYNKFTTNYNGSKEYNRTDNSNEYERKIRDLMVKVMLELTSANNTATSFVSKGLFPRRKRVEANLANTLKSIGNAIGFGQSLDPDRHISDNIGYEYDRETNIPLLSKLKDGSYKRLEPKPEQGLDESEEDYKARVEAVKARNEEATKFNDELDVKLMDKDYESVFEEFIKGAIQANAKTNTKLDLYYLLEYMRTQAKAYRLTGFNNLSVDHRTTTKDRTVYKTQTPKRVIDLIETWSKRFLFDEYKNKSSLDKFAAVGQNIASAKYMMMNITGGIGNVLTGSTNIFMERFAREYFDIKDWETAKFGYYIKSVPSFLVNMNKDNSTDLTDAIIKLMGVVDYNGIRETSRTIDSIEIVNKMRNFAYSPQSAGEHFMQNTAMLAMMISNRVYTENGKTIIGDFHNYTRMIEDVALRKTIEGNTELEELYSKFNNRQREDKNKLKDYLWFKKDINTEFLRSLSNKEYGFKYNEIRKELLANAKEQFESKPKLIDQFVLNEDGFAQFKEESNLDFKLLAGFKGKVVSVNKKIHGVYDRIGGARIESSWVFGSLVMQYHKHIYTGALKHFRVNGYYNESRESIERGFYVSLWDFATTEFKGITDRAKSKHNEDGTNTFIAGIQEVCRAFIDTFLNYKFNYATMSNSEKANCRRALGELVGISYGLLGGIAASCLLLGADDDDDTAKLLGNLALYQADRLSSETIMYNIGMFSEFDKLWSSPVALGQSFKDVGSALNYVAKYFIEGDEFNPNYTTGLYKGENKLGVYIKRQIPIYRGLNRIARLDQNNKYYKLTDNMLSIIPTKSIAEYIMNK